MRKAESELEIEELLSSIQSANTETNISETATILHEEGVNTVQDNDVVQEIKTENADGSQNKKRKKQKHTYIQRLKIEINSLQKENEKLNTKNIKLKATIENNQGQIKNLKRKLANEKKNASISALKVENEKLKKENERLAYTVSNQSREISSLNKELSALQMELYQVTKELYSTRKPTHKLREKADNELLEFGYSVIIKPAKSIISKALSRFPNIS